jgi:hypothetical protein
MSETWKQDILDTRRYEVDFVDVVGSAITIASVSWDIPSELAAEYAADSASISGTKVINYIGNGSPGGSEGNTYECSVTITTDETIPRQFTHTFRIRLGDTFD